jgi:methylisocitrate lyase
MTPTAARRLRELLARPGIVQAPTCYDPLTARIAEQAGFECLSLGGYAMGAHLATSEPLLGLGEVARIVRDIGRACRLPLIVDAGAGWGEPLHVIRTVRDLESAGAAALHMEDQIFPKRAHYHKGTEHVIPAEAMVAKLRAAVAARRDPDFVIIARTDAMRTDGYAEGIRRANAYAEAGADLVMLFPNTLEQARRAPREIRARLVYVNSEGNRLGRPILSVAEAEQMGYKVLYDAITAIAVAFRAVREVFARLRATGRTDLDQAEMIPIRQAVEDTIGLEDLYRIERETVERGT